MAPCLRYTFDECLNNLGIDGDGDGDGDPMNSSDAELLCKEKDLFAEYISAATIAIIIYLFSKYLYYIVFNLI
jgi:hypothetical protein